MRGRKRPSTSQAVIEQAKRPKRPIASTTPATIAPIAVIPETRIVLRDGMREVQTYPVRLARGYVPAHTHSVKHAARWVKDFRRFNDRFSHRHDREVKAGMACPGFRQLKDAARRVSCQAMNEPTGTRVSIIVPTYREAANLAPLTQRLFASTRAAGLDAELIVVDDNSGDGSEEVVNKLAADYPVRIVVRKNERGLSSAVLRGFEDAKADLLLVMDADLQHPPESAPELIHRLASNDCDFVIGTRYGGGAIPAEWPWTRKLSSRVATLLARPLAPLSDPMSGFFALRRETWQRAAGRLNPLGYKIGLELFVKGRCAKPADVPITFGLRHAGTSKFSFREQWLYARHLLRLYRFRYPVWFWGIVVAVFASIIAIVVTLLSP